MAAQFGTTVTPARARCSGYQSEDDLFATRTHAEDTSKHGADRPGPALRQVITREGLMLRGTSSHAMPGLGTLFT